MTAPALGQPVEHREALNAGPVAPGPITLVDNYVAFTATDLTSDAGDPAQVPQSASYGGNFAFYVQHRVRGNVPATGALHGGVRAQVESTAIGNPAAPTNDPVALYGGVYNGGTGLGAFGAHVDAYHAGTAEGRHSTYGVSVEAWKMIEGGVAAGYVARSQDRYAVDYGAVFLNVGQGVGFKRGLQLGAPVYEQGGPVGSAGQVVPFDVGLDLTWGSYRYAAIQIPANSRLIFSGYPQGQDAPPIAYCAARWDEMTGVWSLTNGDLPRFGVNMTDGRLLVSEHAIVDGRLRLWVQKDDGSLLEASLPIEVQR